MNCTFCKTKIPAGKIMFRDECDHCGADLHICLHCSFYDPDVSRQCRETAIPESPNNKERKNLCEYFKQMTAGRGEVGGSNDKVIREQLDALFK